MIDWELILFAGIAALVLGRLYSVLGRKTGAEPPPHILRENAARRNQTDDRNEDGAAQTQAIDPNAMAAEGLQAIARHNPGFFPQTFLENSRQAYSMIVNAFAKGDLDALQNLSTREVFGTYRDQILGRDDKSPEPFNLMRLKSAEIAQASLAEDGTASISTRFEAELTNGERHKSVREIWTFQRSVNSRDPNWRLAGVEVNS